MTLREVADILPELLRDLRNCPATLVSARIAYAIARCPNLEVLAVALEAEAHRLRCPASDRDFLVNDLRALAAELDPPDDNICRKAAAMIEADGAAREKSCEPTQ